MNVCDASSHGDTPMCQIWLSNVQPNTNLHRQTDRQSDFDIPPELRLRGIWLLKINPVVFNLCQTRYMYTALRNFSMSQWRLNFTKIERLWLTLPRSVNFECYVKVTKLIANRDCEQLRVIFSSPRIMNGLRFIKIISF